MSIADVYKRLMASPRCALQSYRNHAEYVAAQVAGNRRKLDRQWATESNIKFLAQYICRTVHGKAGRGVCHGTRRGLEQSWFMKHLPYLAEVLGTEISPTAEQFPHTIQHDFHEPNERLRGLDFIYSNALDHAYDPAKALRTWMEQLHPGGVCIIEHTSSHQANSTSRTDPFGADLEIMPFLICYWGTGRFAVREILELPDRQRDLMTAIVVQRF